MAWIRAADERLDFRFFLIVFLMSSFIDTFKSLIKSSLLPKSLASSKGEYILNNEWFLPISRYLGINVFIKNVLDTYKMND